MEVYKYIFSFLFEYWWIWVPFVFGHILHAIYMNYVWEDWISKIDWVLLKIQIPKEVESSPKNMEQVLATIYGGVWGRGSSEDKVIKGRIMEWLSLEIESNGGIVSFYIRVRREFRQVVESAVYAQYPDIMITEAEDYTKDVPADLPDDKYDIFGTDFTLIREDAYPIRTYMDFKDELSAVKSTTGPAGLMKASGSWVDPMASLVESMANVRPSDKAWVHILIRPEGSGWKDEALKLRDKLIERTPPKPPSALEQTIQDVTSMTKNVASEVAATYTMGTSSDPVYPDPVQGEAPESKMQKQDITPGEMEIIEAIERSVDKIGFKVEYRACHIGLKDPPDRSGFSGIFGAIHQFNSQHLNGFDFRFDTGTKMPRYTFFSDFRLIMRKHKLMDRFKTRVFPVLDKDNYALGVLNIEELATIFHFPASFVQTQMDRAEVRKSSPPTDLPIVE